MEGWACGCRCLRWGHDEGYSRKTRAVNTNLPSFNRDSFVDHGITTKLYPHTLLKPEQDDRVSEIVRENKSSEDRKMTEPPFFRVKQYISGQSSSGLLHLLFLLFFASASLSCSAKPGASSNSNSVPNTPASSPVAQGAPAETESNQRKVFNTGEAVPAGYLGYKVFASWFSDRGAGRYLYVDLAVVNTDKKERAVAPLKLIDETGREYGLSEKSPAKGEGVLKIGKVSPNVSKRAIALFEVPRGHEYKLKIQGFSATDEVQIALKPGATPPSR